MSKNGKIISVTCSEKFMKSFCGKNRIFTYANNVLSLRSVRVTSIDAIVFPLFKVNPIDPNIVFVTVLFNVIVEVQNIVT